MSILSTLSSLPRSVPCIFKEKAILFRTVSQGKRAAFWNTIPRSGAGPSMAFPSTVKVPVVGLINPAIRRRIVDFPQPEGPTRLINSPLSIVVEI